MASLAEATYQRRVFAWQGAAREPWSGTEATSAGVGWTLQKDDVVVLIEQLRNAAGAAVAFVELQVDGKRTQRRGWVDPAHLKRRAGDETDDELATRREQLAAAAAEHLASRRWTEAYHAYAEAIAADPANHVLFSNRALCCARLHRAAPSAELRAAGRADAERCVELAPAFLRGHERLVAMLSLAIDAGEGDRRTLETLIRRGLRVDAASAPLRRALQELRDAGHMLDATLRPTDAELADAVTAAAPKTRGAELFARGDFAGAAKFFDEALARDATDPALWSNRAACSSQLGRQEAALRDADYAIRFDPRGARAQYRRGVALRGLGRAGDARDACDAGRLDGDENTKTALGALREQCALD
jgi:tetratricopeptide (TPR) repeat protein